MQLTQKQESMISRFLRDLAAQLDGDLPEQSRERSLRQVQSRIYKELEALPKSAINDDDVMTVLRQATPQRHTAPAPPVTPISAARPAATAPAPPARPQQPPPPADEMAAPVWLGVCAFNADRFGIPTWGIRLFVVIFGLLTGPLAAFCYLAGYVEFYLTVETSERPQIDYGRLVLRTVTPLLVAIAIRWGAYKILDLIAYGYEKGFGVPLPLLGHWDWLAHYDGSLFFLLCASIIPLAILSGLPLANAWEHSLKRMTQALVALYFMALSFGIASILVGIILDQVQPYME